MYHRKPSSNTYDRVVERVDCVRMVEELQVVFLLGKAAVSNPMVPRCLVKDVRVASGGGLAQPETRQQHHGHNNSFDVFSISRGWRCTFSSTLGGISGIIPSYTWVFVVVVKGEYTNAKKFGKNKPRGSGSHPIQSIIYNGAEEETV